MNWMALLVVLVAAAFLALMLRKHQPEYALIIGLIAGALVLTVVITQAQPLFSTINKLLESAGIPGEYGARMFKALGICLLTQLASDACRDAGEAGLAGKAELVGKISLLGLALPLFETIAQTSASLINGQ